MFKFFSPPPGPDKIGLILSGGGARAAYQVGVLRGIANILPRQSTNPFQIISGTSAGALNAVSLAAHASRLRTGVRTLEYVWENLSSSKVYRLDSGGIIASASSWVMALVSGRQTEAPASLLNTAPLRELLASNIHFDRIQQHIDCGLLDALSVTVSSYSSGQSVSFFQGLKEIDEWEGPHRIGRRSLINLDLIMASSAIPTIFPAVRIDDQYFGDGSIRQLAPTSTALHLGANKILAIGVSATKYRRQTSNSDLGHPSLSQIIGHILNSAFVDTLENDLEFLRHMNEVLPHVSRRRLQKQKLRHQVVELLDISPSRDLNEIAAEHFEELPRAMKLFIKDPNSSILSLLLFEPGYCRALLDLGHADAMAREPDIRKFFRTPAQPGR